MGVLLHKRRVLFGVTTENEEDQLGEKGSAVPLAKISRAARATCVRSVTSLRSHSLSARVASRFARVAASMACTSCCAGTYNQRKLGKP